MGQIQSGINQIIGQIGVLSHLNPKFRAEAEKKAKIEELTKKANAASEAGKIIAADVSSKLGTPEFLETAEPTLAIAREKVSAAEELFKIDPTKERYEKASMLKKELNSMENIISQLREKGMNQVKQKYSFQDLINDVSKAEREGYING